MRKHKGGKPSEKKELLTKIVLIISAAKDVVEILTEIAKLFK